MLEITAKLVKELRVKTYAPVIDCKNALIEANGDLTRAYEILRIKLGNKISSISSKDASEGAVSIATSNNNICSLVEVNCETDFVSKNASFIDFVDKLARVVIKNNPANLDVLQNLPFWLSNKTVNDARIEIMGFFNENISIKRFKYLKTNHKLAHYLHGHRIAVVVEFTGLDKSIGKDIAMHIAAMRPLSLTSDQIPKDLMDKELKLASEKAMDLSKLPTNTQKIADGLIRKYIQEVSLYDQYFIKDNTKIVRDVLRECKASVYSFFSFIVGK